MVSEPNLGTFGSLTAMSEEIASDGFSKTIQSASVRIGKKLDKMNWQLDRLLERFGISLEDKGTDYLVLKEDQESKARPKVSKILNIESNEVEQASVTQSADVEESDPVEGVIQSSDAEESNNVEGDLNRSPITLKALPELAEARSCLMDSATCSYTTFKLMTIEIKETNDFPMSRLSDGRKVFDKMSKKRLHNNSCGRYSEIHILCYVHHILHIIQVCYLPMERGPPGKYVSNLGIECPGDISKSRMVTGYFPSNFLHGYVEKQIESHLLEIVPGFCLMNTFLMVLIKNILNEVCFFSEMPMFFFLRHLQFDQKIEVVHVNSNITGYKSLHVTILLPLEIQAKLGVKVDGCVPYDCYVKRADWSLLAIQRRGREILFVEGPGNVFDSSGREILFVEGRGNIIDTKIGENPEVQLIGYELWTNLVSPRSSTTLIKFTVAMISMKIKLPILNLKHIVPITNAKLACSKILETVPNQKICWVALSNFVAIEFDSLVVATLLISGVMKVKYSEVTRTDFHMVRRAIVLLRTNINSIIMLDICSKGQFAIKNFNGWSIWFGSVIFQTFVVNLYASHNLKSCQLRSLYENFSAAAVANLSGCICFLCLATALPIHLDELGRKDDKASLVFDSGASEDTRLYINKEYLFRIGLKLLSADALRFCPEIRVTDLGMKYISSIILLHCNLVVDLAVVLPAIPPGYGRNEGGDDLGKVGDRTILVFNAGGWNVDRLLLIANSAISFIDRAKEHYLLGSMIAAIHESSFINNLEDKVDFKRDGL